MALFDVLMPVRNGEAFIRQAVSSVQAQTVRDWRLLVLDHGSTDRTADIVDQLSQADARIERHPFPQAKGLAGLLNEGLALVQAPMALRMDADDECLPERMAFTQDTFARNPGVAVVGGQAVMIDADGRLLGELAYPCDRDVLTRRAMFRSTFAHPTVTFSSRHVADLGLRYGVSMYRDRDPLATIQVPNLAEDYLMFGELGVSGLAINSPQVFLRYRMHPGGVSRQKYTDQMHLSAEISRHLAAIVCRQVGMPVFDPVPFCSHAQILFDVGAKTDYRDEYERLRSALSRGGGAWRDTREVSWRGVFVDRSLIGLVTRAARRYRASNADDWEWRTAMNAARGILRGRQRINIPPAAVGEPVAG